MCGRYIALIQGNFKTISYYLIGIAIGGVLEYFLVSNSLTQTLITCLAVLAGWGIGAGIAWGIRRF